MADTTTELEVLDQIVDVLGGQSGQHETVVPTLQQILALLGGGGGGGGYNPSLSVGRADALTGADETAQWAQRTTEGSGAATVRSVQGAAVTWEQRVNGFTNVKVETSHATSEVADNTLTLTCKSGITSGAVIYLQNTLNAADVGHRFMLVFDVLVTSTAASTTMRLDYSAMANLLTPTAVSSGTWQRVALYATIAAASSTTQLLYYNTANDLAENDTLQFRNIQLFDLTALYGAGNEPATLAAFNADYPASYYPYSAPTLKPVQIAGIESTDAQGGELDSVEWTAQTLRAAGSVRDELTAGELVTRVGVVQVTGGASSTIAQSTDGTCINALVLIPNYDSTTGGGISSDQFIETSAGWRTIGLYEVRNAGASGGVFIGLPLDVSTQAQVNAWLAEHKPTFYYELANPTTTPIRPALPMTYKVQQGGSENVIVPAGEVSAAPILTVAEGESAAELMMDALACIAAPDGPTATANHAVNTYLTMGGKLYKVTSAIAVGESITPNTNVTETTVMAELIARTA